MRWRAGEGHVAAGERDAAADALGRSHAIAAELGAGWLRGEIESLAARARLTLPGAAPAAAEPAAAPAASVRVRTSSLARIRDTCTLAVFSEMNSVSPIRRLV